MKKLLFLLLLCPLFSNAQWKPINWGSAQALIADTSRIRVDKGASGYAELRTNWGNDLRFLRNQNAAPQTFTFNMSGLATVHGGVVGYSGFFALKNPGIIGTPFYSYSDSLNNRLFTDNLIGVKTGTGNIGADYVRYSHYDNGNIHQIVRSENRDSGHTILNDLPTSDDGNWLQVNGGISSRNNSITGKTESYTENSSKLASTAFVRRMYDSLSVYRNLVSKIDTIFSVGDSQMYGTNYTYPGNRLDAKYRIPNIFAGTQDKKLTVMNVAVPASRIGWQPSGVTYLQQGTFNTLGNLTPGWQGVLMTMAGWNNVYTSMADTSLVTMRNAYQGIIARGLIDGYAGISANMWDYSKNANVNSGITSGTTASDASVTTNSTSFTPFPTNVNTDPRYKTVLAVGDSLKFTLSTKRAIALFYDTDTIAGGEFDVYINNYKVGSYTSTYQDQSKSADRFSQVVWLENVPASATVKIRQEGTGHTHFLAYGWVNKAGSKVDKKTILMGGVTGDTANVRLSKDLWRMNLAAQQAAGTFTGYPVFYANTYNSYYHPTDQEPTDISHLTPTGSLHMAQAFNTATSAKTHLSPNFVVLKDMAHVPLWSSGTLTRIMAYNDLHKRAEYITPAALNVVMGSSLTAPAGTLTGTTLASNVVTSSLTSVGTLTNLTVTNPITGSVTGNAATATALATGRTIGTLTGDVTTAGSSFNGTANNTNATVLATVNSNVGSFGSSTSIPSITVNGKGLVTAVSGNAVIAPAGTLSGSTLTSGVTASSLTSVGTLTSLNVSNDVGVGTTIPNYSGYSRAISVIAPSGGNLGSTEVGSLRADADGVAIGELTGIQAASTNGDKRIGFIRFNTQGATANARGGSITLVTRQSNSASFNTNLTLDNTGGTTAGGAFGINNVANSVTSATYTPTGTNVTGTSAITTRLSTYTRIGDVVHVSGYITVTGGVGANILRMTLPIASNFALATDCHGVGNADNSATLGTVVSTDTTNDQAQLSWTGTGASGGTVYYQYDYIIK